MLRVCIVLSVLFFLSCDTNKPLDRDAIKKEMKNRELKRLTDLEVMEKASEMGFQIWSALSVPDANSQEILKNFYLEIDTLKWKDNPLTSQEKDILEAYQYATEQKITPAPGIQGGTDKLIFFCAPYLQGDSIRGVIVIKILKKEIVLSI